MFNYKIFTGITSLYFMTVQFRLRLSFITKNICLLTTVIIACFYFSSPLLAGQLTQNPLDNQQNNPVAFHPFTDDLPTTRVGVDKNKVLKLSVDEAVLRLLTNNLDVQLEKDNVKQVEFNLQSAKGVYDYFLKSNFGYSASRLPVRTIDGSSNGFVEKDEYTYGVGLTKLFSTGGRLETEFSNTRTFTTAITTSLNPFFESTVKNTFSQPLLKNFINNPERNKIQILKKRLAVLDLELRKKLIRLIAQTQAAYFDLAFCLSNAEIQREAVELAIAQVRKNEAEVKVGRLAPIEVISAQAELERRREEAMLAITAITEAENQLKLLLLNDPNDQIWDYVIIPTDPISLVVESTSLIDATNMALNQRPEIKQLGVFEEVNKTDVNFLKNQGKPQLDLFFSFSTKGIAGIPRPLGFFSPLAPKDFIGGYGQTLTNLFKFRTYEVGINLILPLGNTTAKAELGRALVEQKQLLTQKRQTSQLIMAEVRNALQSLESAIRRVQASQATVLAEKKQLEAEEYRFSVGLSTTFLILQRQNSLSLAKARELRTKIDYLKSRAHLQEVMGNNIP